MINIQRPKVIQNPIKKQIEMQKIVLQDIYFPLFIRKIINIQLSFGNKIYFQSKAKRQKRKLSQTPKSMQFNTQHPIYYGNLWVVNGK